MSGSTLDALPPELLLMIGSHITKLNHLWWLMRTCKTLHFTLEQSLYALAHILQTNKAAYWAIRKNNRATWARVLKVDSERLGLHHLAFAALFGKDLDMLKELMQLPSVKQQFIEDECDHIGLSPLILAAHSGRADFVKYLLEQGADPRSRHMWVDKPNDPMKEFRQTALHAAVRSGQIEVVRLLLQWGADRGAIDAEGCTPAFKAAELGHLEILQLLYVNRTTIHVSRDRTMLEVAARNGHPEVVRYLIFRMRNPVRHALIMAATEGRLDVMKEIPRSVIANSLSVIGYGTRPTASNAGPSHLAGIKYLIDNGAEVDMQDAEGQTALHKAVLGGAINVVMLLLKAGANASVVNDHGQTPLFIAASSEVIELVRILYPRDAVRRDAKNRTLLHVCRSVPIMEELLAKGEDPTAKDCWGRTPLIMAIKRGNVSVTLGLLRRNCEFAAGDLRAPDLMKAARGGVPMLKLLHQKGVQMNQHDLGGKTLLHHAAGWLSDDAAVEFAIHAGVDVNRRDCFNHIALHYACQYASTKIAVRLLLAGSAVNAADAYGRTPLTFAMGCLVGKHFSLGCVASLLHYKADPRHIPVGHPSPLHMAAQTGNLDLLRTFLYYGARVDRIDAPGFLVEFPKDRGLEIVSLLVGHGMPLTYRDRLGNTMLMKAARHGNGELLQYLIDRGLSVSARNNEGNQALHIACSGVNPDAIATLIRNGADVTARNNSGITPLQHCFIRAPMLTSQEELNKMLCQMERDADRAVKLLLENGVGEVEDITWYLGRISDSMERRRLLRYQLKKQLRQQQAQQQHDADTKSSSPPASKSASVMEASSTGVVAQG